jgi:hypothetical protein
MKQDLRFCGPPNKPGRLLGNAHFIEGLERFLKRRIARRAPGRKPAPKAEDQNRLV